MRKLLSVFLSIIMMLTITVGLSFNVYALDSNGSCGKNVTYTFNSSTGKLVISGTGAMSGYSYSGTNASPFNSNTNIKTIVIGSGITSIGSNSFTNCSAVTSVTIPNTVTSIGGSAFYGCKALTSITIPKEVTSIGEYAFNNCTSLSEIFYMGTREEWNSITKPDSFIPSSATIYYHEHKFAKIDTVSSGCYEDGYVLYRCDECGKEYHDIIPSSHISAEPVVENIFSPTCIENGTYDEVVYCSVCGEELSRNTIGAKTEIFVDDSEYPESPHNYYSNMNETYSFSYLGADSLRITFSSLTETESGCDYIYLYDSNGSQIGKYDGKSLAGKTITINGDSFSVKLSSDDSVQKYGFAFSSICAAFEDQSLLATGHVYGASVVENYVGSTCIENGSYDEVVYCSVCGGEISREIKVVNSAHKYELADYIESDCENDGLTILECSACGDIIFEEPKALGHDIVIDESVTATCTTDGFTEGQHCIRCDKIMVAQDIIPATGHSYIKTDSKSPSCTKDGFDIFDCRVCSATETIWVDALGHSYDVSIDDGVIGYSCQRCDDNAQKTFDEVVNMWDMNYFNKAESECPFLDIVDDGIINAKDYAMLRNLQKNN